MRIVINGADWSADIDPYSILPFHEKVQGPNSGTSMGGSTILDTIAVKNGFNATALLLTQEKYSALVALAKMDVVTVDYDDPDTNAPVSRKMMLTAQNAKQVPLLGGGYVYKGMTLNFVEK